MKQVITLLCILVILFEYAGPLSELFVPLSTEAAQVTIDASVSTIPTSHIQSGSQTVFVSDLVGYKFYRDVSGNCAYSKTTDGGASWGAPVSVDAQADCIGIQVWYDKWTPGLPTASSSIHIMTADTSADDLFYNRLDTAGDTLLMGSAPVSMVGAQGGSMVEGENYGDITRGSDGTIYAVSNDGSNPTADSYIVECTVNCGVAGNWTETGINPLDVASDFNMLVPLSGGSIMVINRDISADDIRTKIWNNVSWSATWTAVDAAAPENITYDIGMAAAVSSTTPGVVYLAYIANNDTLGTNDVIRSAKYNGTSWTATAGPLTSTTRGLTNVAIGLDAANDDVYVAYSGRTTAGTAGTANVYWKWATSSMQIWSAEVGPINSSPDDFYGVDLNLASDQRIYATWYDITDDDIYGDTIADVFPGVHASTSGSQIASSTANTSNFYIGGAFVLYNTYVRTAFDVTSLTFTEAGSIDGDAGIGNIKLLYEMDTSAPYNCASVSYDGSETQFGSTDTTGFSGANGVSSFSGSTVSISTTTAFCGYIVLDILDDALSSTTIDISINNPVTDITVTNSTAGPASVQGLQGDTFVYNDTPTLTHFHWRNDDGSEVAATSRTGNTEDTALTALQAGSPVRLRMQVSNEGSTTTGPMQYRLEYGVTSDQCIIADVASWTDVGAAGGDFDMYASTHITDGANTTNISVASGGVSDENTTFLSSNGGVKDTSSQTGAITLLRDQFVELEYAIVASTSAMEGTSYCFRVSNAGTALPVYSILPRANIAADVLVTVATTTSQVATANLPATNQYVGSSFVITENAGSRNVTSITIGEDGTVDGVLDLDNIRLYYDLDTSLPYNCVSEAYTGGESQFGATDTDGFSSDNGTSTFVGTVGITTTATMCVYIVLDTTSTARNGETINITMPSPSVNLLVSGGGSVSPSVQRDMNGLTTLVGAVLTQTHYHWRNDNASEAAASSMTGGVEDVPITNMAQSTPARLRIQLSNEGGISAASRAYILEYGTKLTSCSAIGTWIDVGALGGAFDMFNSTNLTDGNNTTNIALGTGGVTDENTTFLTPNLAIKDTSSLVASTTISSTQYLEAEFSIQQTSDAGYDTTYCFRLTGSNTELDSFLEYPELTTAPERDFEIQRGSTVVSGTSATLTAGVDYVAPSASTSAFIRITNTTPTGAGLNGATSNADDITAYILNPSDIMTSITISRPATALNSTRVSWEIVEFIGEPGSDNEMIVRSQTGVTYGTAATAATGPTVAGIVNDNDVVVFITGLFNPDIAATNHNSGLSTSNWDWPTNAPTFARGDAGGDAARVSYAVVEFTGMNWNVQRSEHTYTSAGTTETESITAVNSLARTFLHTQKRVATGLTGTDEYGHEVWLSSIGFVSYFLESGATTPSGQTSVAWVIENTQVTSGAMDVTRSSGSTNAGTVPFTLSVAIGKTLTDITNASLFTNARVAGTGTIYPRPVAGAIIASTTHYELWRANTGAALTFRTEVVEWPTAGLSIKQNYYRLYVDNNALDPTDPWPIGGVDLGENTVLTATDEPLGEGERIRIRMSLRVLNATLPTTTRAFRLQYAPLVSTCSAISANVWQTLGDNASSTIWRGYAAAGTSDGMALSGNPPTPGDLNLSVSDVAGTLEEENDTSANTYRVLEGDDIEYDWMIEQNGANAGTFYCFRMVESDNTVLDGYLQYPQILTASFTPRSQNWRWYDDELNATPATSLAAENTSPIDITNTQTIVLRMTVKETKNVAQENTRFKLQYAENVDFSDAADVVASSTCIATSTWCYGVGFGTDNAGIANATLSDTSGCSGGTGDGCGTYNLSSLLIGGFRHENSAAVEYSFILHSAQPELNRVYYFRLYDLVQNMPVETNTGESYPSLVTEGATLTFGLTGVSAFTSVEGITTDVATTPTSIPYGTLNVNTDTEAAYRLQVSTDAPQGYEIYMVATSDLMNSSGDPFTPITATNGTPNAWNTACSGSAAGCFGYHTGDDTLEGGSTRFAANDTYARLSTTTPDEVGFYSGPVTNDTLDIVFRIKAQALQPSGQYTTSIRYIATPVF